eukprot:gb/GECG01007914.1/.p1 GENE.gb/GECG01007914.1/~~gb/GECG01007914.1/.p1  ORF type:complete len:284 (+),score=31.49 gb/GECG01007914.1/:1-852(+)
MWNFASAKQATLVLRSRFLKIVKFSCPFTMSAALASKIALVTGAASGLGRATAERFIKHGAKVVIADLPSTNGESVAKEIGAHFAPTDVTSADDVTKALDMCQQEYGPLNAVVQCAGLAPPKKILGKKGVHDLEHFQKIVNVNLVGTFNVLRLAAERMSAGEAAEDNERGVIINTASVAAFEGQIGQCAYGSSKGGVASLSLPAARELAAHGIRVNSIAPGVFMTPMMEGLPDKVKDELGATVPFPQRLGTPEEYAALAQHLVENRYINGECIRLDGGLRMSS